MTPAPTAAWAAVSLLGGGIAWAAHLLASYAVVSVGCATGWTGTRPLLGAVTAACAALALATGVVAHRGRRRPVTDTAAPAPPAARLAFGVGAGLAGLFTALILLAGIVPFFVPLCATGW